jgi:hypothetical protein
VSKSDIEKAIADEFYKLADLFNQLGAADASGPARPDGAGAGASPSPALASSYEASPFDEPASYPTRASVDVLSECPVHFRPWEVKEGGISKAGKPYNAFWKCNGKNDDGSYCSKKPTKEWAQAHPAERAVAA